MTKTTLYVLLLKMLLLSSVINAQTYQNLIMNGFNADVIANGTGSAATTTTHDVDGVSFCFKSIDWKLTGSSLAQTSGFPANTIVTSGVAATPGLTYTLQNYSANNSIRLTSTTTSITSSITNIIQAKKLYVLATSGGGASIMECVITFTDNTTQTISSLTVPDWYDGNNPPFAYRGFGRLNRNNNAVENSSTNPRLYQVTLTIPMANQTKQIQSIEFKRLPSSSGILNVFAITAEVLGTCPSPDTATISAITSSTATAVIEPPAIIPGEGYNYEVRTSGTAGSGTTGLITSGTIPSGSTTAYLTGLPAAQLLYFYVRSNCGTEQGTWTSVASFATVCDVFAAPTLVEDFSNYTDSISATSLPCWQEATATSIGGTLTIGNNSWKDKNFNDNPFHPNGKAAYINLYGTLNNWLISPSIDLGSAADATNFRLRYAVALKPYSTTNTVTNMGNKSVTVLISTDNGATWSAANILKVYDTSNIPATGGSTESIDLSSYSGIVKFAFYAKSSSTLPDLSFFIDNFKVEETPSCSDVGNLNAQINTPANAALLSWQTITAPAASLFDIEWGVQGFTPGSGTLITGVSNPYQLNNLTLNTTYAFRVRANCGSAGLGAWSGFSLFYFGYCSSVPTSIDHDGITKVVLAGHTFNTPNISYHNLTGTVVEVDPSAPIPSAVTFATTYTYGTNIWIDLDNNGIFNNTNELVFQGTSTNQSPTTLNTTFSLPNTTAPGEYYMRIGTADEGQNPPDSCYSDTYGVTVDMKIKVPVPCPTITSIGKTDTVCSDGATGSATVNMSDTTASYTYSWNTNPVQTTATATGLAAGTYTVTVTTGNCTVTGNVTILAPAAFTLLPSQQDVSCNGASDGTATVSVTGGTAPYTYAWDNGQTTATATGLNAGLYTVTITDASDCTISQTVTITEPAPLTVVPAQTNVLCYGDSNGTATITAAGGTPPYTYSWSSVSDTTATAVGLSSGSHTVVVTDAHGCSTSHVFTITQPAELSATTTQVNTTCSPTGEASISVSGGTGPYTYQWTPVAGDTASVSDLAPGDYTVTATDANGCTISRSFTITQSSDFTVTVSATDVSCKNGANATATVMATGGTAPYAYSWAHSGETTSSVSGLTAGTYTVTTTDVTGCTNIQNITIAEPEALSATTAMVHVSCNGGSNGSATVTPTGGTAPYTYLWTHDGGTNATALGLNAGTYFVNITDANNCTISEQVIITEPAALAVTTSSVNVSCNGGSNGAATVTLTGGTPPYSYSWNNGITATTHTVDNLPAGTYTVTATDANNCSVSASFIITQPAALTATLSKTDVSCNGGSNGSATVNVSGGTGTYTYLWNTIPAQTTATATGLTAGTYTVTVEDTNNCSISHIITIAQPDAMVVTTSATAATCNGASDGSATVTITNGSGNYTYSWTTTPVQTTATASGLSTGNYTVTITDTVKGCTATADVTISQPAAILITADSTNVSCHGGSNGTATLTVSGGTAPYTYSWEANNSITATASGLAAGNYTVTVTDDRGCIKTHTVTITQPDMLNIMVDNQTNVSCKGTATGTVTVAATGGMAPYTYLWNNGAALPAVNELTAGDYSVTITDANGCIKTRTVTITEPDTLTATATAVAHVTCNDGNNGSATVHVTGGTIPYSYSWNTIPAQTTATATGLMAGTHTVTVADANGCTVTQSVIITAPAALNITASQNNTTCNGESNGSATVNVSGGSAPYTYSWSNGATSAAIYTVSAGVYTVLVTDSNGCSQTETFTITEPAPIAAPQANNQAFCIQQNAKVVNLTAAGAAIKWYTSSTGGNALAPATALTSGSYYASQTINGCESQGRTQIQVIIYTTTAPAAAANQVFCYTSSPKISNLEVSGTGIRWYASTTSTTPLAYTTALLNGTTYYASQTLNGCESVGRTAVTVQINTTTPPTPVAATQSFCYQAKVSNLVVTGQPGAVFSWYHNATTTIPLNSNQFITDGIYYVEQKVDQCTSQRIAVQVYVSSNIQPGSIQPFYFCESATVADLYVPAAANTSYKWYTALNSPQNLPGTTPLQTGTYYVSKVRMNCESMRVPVQVTIEARPDSPVGATYQIFNQEAAIANLDAQPYSSTKWYISENDALSNNNPLPVTTPLIDGATYYGAVTTPNGCSSIPLAVTVKVELPAGNEKFDQNRFVYYPNPVEDQLTIKGPQIIQLVEVYNLIGQQVLRKEYEANEVIVPLGTLASGSYMILVKDSQSRSFIKVIKK